MASHQTVVEQQITMDDTAGQISDTQPDPSQRQVGASRPPESNSSDNANESRQQHMIQPPPRQARRATKSNHHPLEANLKNVINTSGLLTANDFKNAGNKFCALSRYEEAINHYSKAIAKDSDVAIFYSNRALCQLKLQQWSLAVQDCRRALELEPNLIKAKFFLGQALAELGNYDEALKHLQRAHELARENKMNYGDDITYQIRLVKRNRWNKAEDEATRLEDELHAYLLELIDSDKNKKLSRLKDSPGEGSSKQANVSPSSPHASASNEETNLDITQQQIKTKCDTYVDKLDSMFNNLKLQRKKRDVPDYLCGKISFEIMNDPVITPCGVTYERQDIEEHLRRVGHFDPITRQHLTSSQLVPNLAMREVVDAYLAENEWAMYH